MAAVLIALRVLAGLAGVGLALATMASAVRTVIVPRAIPARLASAVFLVVGQVYRLRLGRAASYTARDRAMATFAPVSLLALLGAWLSVMWLAFGLLLWGTDGGSGWAALRLSGSSLLTLGFAVPGSVVATVVEFAEAGTGLVLLALLITYLPSLYQAFARREALISKLEVRAGAPPTGWELLSRAWRLERFDLLAPLWSVWEDWFVDLEESHTSFPALPFFRSPEADHSWVTAAGAVLDAAALLCAAVDVPRDIDAELTIRAGYLALRRIAAFFAIPFDPDPTAGDPIMLTREEYDVAVGELAAAGVPLRGDQEAAWRDFAGWRVNYDAVLVALAGMVTAPYAPWSSDRSRPSRPPRPQWFARQPVAVHGPGHDLLPGPSAGSLPRS